MNKASTKIFQYKSLHRPTSSHANYSSQKQQGSYNNHPMEDRIRALELNQAQSNNLSNENTSQNLSRNRGIEQEATNHSRKSESDRRIVEGLVRQSNRRIMSVSSTFPWSIFPNSIDIEESRITFHFRQFLSYQSHSVDIKDITNVFIQSGLVFATLQVVSRTYIQNDIKIEFLKKKQAVQARQIIEGMRTFVQNNIDTSNYEITELLNKLEELHTSDHAKHRRHSIVK